MLLRETGFSFGGEHCYAHYGLMYAEKDAGHQTWGAVRRNEYEIAGQSGTVLFDGAEQGVLTFSGTLYPHDEPRTQADAQRIIRRAQKWLLSGRKKLIFDYEPEYYYLAQLSKASQWSLKNWFGGELGITFEAQPYAYACHENVVSVSGSGAVSAVVQMNTLWDAPAAIRVSNAGAANVTRVSVNDGQILFEELAIAPQECLEIRCEAPVGAALHNESALPWCEYFRPVLLKTGANELTVEADGDVSVEIRARGRW